jgi:N-acetyl-gamma-glutamyl-phosphate reductase
LAHDDAEYADVSRCDVKVGVLGASGYAGAELLRLCAGHPQMEVVVAGAASQAGVLVAELYPSLSLAYPSLSFSAAGPREVEGLDVLFLAMPHGSSAPMMGDLLDAVGAVVDLSADFRLRDSSAYPRWYGWDHPAPDLLGRFAFGLPELFREEMAGARSVAVPGCYVTAAALALTPLVRGGMVDPGGVVVDAASGVSGAGRGPADHTQFCAVDEGYSAYSPGVHRHTPEIEQATGAQVVFTPHLAPMTRGLLATCYARPVAGANGEDLLGALHSQYGAEPFVEVGGPVPSTKSTLGSNAAHLGVHHDERTGWAVVLCALDNLMKGAAGQALQCANLLCGLPEPTGLSPAGMYP